MDGNGKRKRGQLSEDEATDRIFSLPNEAGLDYIDESSSDDEQYIVTSTSLLQSRPENDMMIHPYDLGAHVAPINAGNGSNVNSGPEIMTSVMNVQANNGNSYAHSRRKWTYEMDERLREGYNIYGKQWSKVADHVGYGLHREQCRKRWSMAANVELQSRRKGEWSEEELVRLKLLAESNENRRATNGGLQRKDMVNWTLISKELNRDYKECADKYKSMMSSTMIKGPYTREEDAFILARVREWGNKGQGLWIQLQSEMNRRSDSINKRWQRLVRSPDSVYVSEQPQQQQPQQQQKSGGDLSAMF